MASISTYLQKILSAVYGEEVRGAIHDAIDAINTEATNAADSASGSQDSAAAKAKEAESYAKGGTNSRDGEDTDNAKYYKELAKSSAQKSDDAADASESYAHGANSSAQQAAQSADNSAAAALSASTYAKEAESYAKGGTNSRDGEDTDNAKYYKEQAENAAVSLSGAIEKLDDIGGGPPLATNTETGSFVEIDDAAAMEPISCITTLEPIQSGEGDPSLDNIRSISGHTGASITVNGETFNVDFVNGNGDPLTVYGGTFNWLTGVLTVTMASALVSDYTDWNKLSSINGYYISNLSPIKKQSVSDVICDRYVNSGMSGSNPRVTGSSSTSNVYFRSMPYETTSEFRESEANTRFVYARNTSVTYRFAAHSFTLSRGENSIQSVSGETALTYYVDDAIANNERINNHEGRINEVEQTLDDAIANKDRIDDHEGRINDHEGRIDTLEDRTDAIENELDKIPIASPLTQKSLTGTSLSFRDAACMAPISLKTIADAHRGSGIPGAFSAYTFTITGKNMANAAAASAYSGNKHTVTYNAEEQSVRVAGTGAYPCAHIQMRLQAGVTYTISAYCAVATGYCKLALRRGTVGTPVASDNSLYVDGWSSFKYTPAEGGTYNIALFCHYSGTSAAGDTTFSQIQCEVGASKTDYEPFAGETKTITFLPVGETDPVEIRAGELDLTTGVLTKTWEYMAEYDGSTLPGDYITEDGDPPVAGQPVAYELATPVTYQLAPTNIKLLRGDNSVWSSVLGDSTALTYYVDDIMMLQAQIDELRATLLENTNG